ncbi:hypothetical protein FB451DRAFT_19135 [Mycena latifolia]|nr:hypothetical protein FB451DRAFT_19135 [Mycena latifolia]
MAKIVSSQSVQLVTFSTTLPVAEVISRLDKEIGKPPAGAPALPRLGDAASQEALKTRVESLIGPSGFLYFEEFNYGRLVELYSNARAPRAVMYIIGNPLIAQTVLQYDLRGGCNIPLRLLVLEKPNGLGTDVIYHLPSSVIVLDDNVVVKDKVPVLKATVEALDRKLESVVERITAA